MMPPTGRECCQSLMPDIISNLPHNVIDVILILLPFKDAVRTSVLSKKWRYHWCRRTELTLDESLWKQREDLNPTVRFREIISQLLTLHEGPITKFTLDIVHLKRLPEIDDFIYFLRNHIQDLVLRLPLRKQYALPSTLFTCSQLRHLNLHSCSIYHPSAFEGFDKLISLELCGVSTSSELLESLISHCPLLEQLELSTSEDLDMIEINAPMLRFFSFTGNISSIYLKNVPRLVEAFLLGDIEQTESLDFAKIFESCSALEQLSLDFLSSEFVAEEGYKVPKRLPFNLNVRRFDLLDISLVESYKLSHILCLLRSFPYLEYLEMQVIDEDDSDTDEDEDEESLQPETLSDLTFNHLVEFQLGSFIGGTSEMQFIKHLLANSPVLEILVINRQFLDKEPLDTREEIFTKISNFPRTSPKAEIVYKDFS
ncbi:F-box/FBD/LRR-repeat protein At1g13570 [Solanum lycopersicum]|uniref:F-box/FBD/LRR-repeat protein At1g13570 n=1 Tax=Solanum lycopersicum TaxID=4081 RepID=UPI0002BCAF12|nr:F-box/FBD/LRR-repeat protein At1g13570 [Solanum lycopersicum]XP_010323654.1 F-box/FBD/LRR-repeat protein At1g13570 [Solanum lycopersicum]XP_010323655.1 F-box/FBD/LRR-repeat protein At1g13570 [Solanum lycopersicum]XP_010323656.1 F-box/FBD/LRR-repeat protein At1g13570 [Solanum lycopersicum]XP_010323657.1 F-box/FBD/LRR-repeat protein At1g13570 [Solanum lycopersicum]XP_010323658.1 F-box/FBD/LRR-repeat protein At1g13570 [Solanum lycopersicum]XP_010323659.1 F-box/FBD/LRR-repeat protein At1g13570